MKETAAAMTMTTTSPLDALAERAEGLRLQADRLFVAAGPVLAAAQALSADLEQLFPDIRDRAFDEAFDTTGIAAVWFRIFDLAELLDGAGRPA